MEIHESRDAIASFNKALAISPANAMAYYQRGLAHRNLNQDP